jgi:large subunit ribosomal protein L17
MNRRKLGRYNAHYLALMRNLAISLIEYGKIKTTIQKAKELRRYVEPLITLAKNNTLTSYKRLLSKLLNNRNAVNKLMKIGEMNRERNGGYTSIKRLFIRQNDSAVVSEISIIDYIVDLSSGSIEVKEGQDGSVSS